MRLLATVICLGTLFQLLGQETPLKELPYTPSLETKFMDRAADPCVDFFRYACGSWSKVNPIPADQADWNVYRKMEDDNQRFLWSILQQEAQPNAGRSQNEQKIGDYFHACMDEKAIDQAGSKPLEAALSIISGLKSVDEIGRYVGIQERQGIDRKALFGLSAEPDFDHSSQMMAFVSAGGLGLPDRDYYTKTDAKSVEIRQKYVEHVGRMFQLLGESPSDARADSQVVMELETALAKASLTRTEKRDPYNLKHRMNVEELRRLAPAFGWDSYFEEMATPKFSEVNVTEPKFLNEVNVQLRTRSLAQWRAFLRWRLLHTNARFLSNAFVDENFKFFGHYLAGLEQMPPRWKRCTRLVDEQLGDALGEVFVTKTFAPQTKQDAAKMIQQIEEEMATDLKELSWMSEATRKQALEKLHGIANKVGYPEKWKNYSSVGIDPGEFHANALHASEFEARRDLAKIGNPVDRSEWQMTPPTVNAYYDPQTNDINFPAGVLQPPLFDPKTDAAPNYGNTGATMGHELTHGFDDEGRQYDAQGNLRDWWTKADAEAFRDRANCVRDQYANYTVIDDIHINSKLTLGEDVADLGGTLLAYLAWKHTTSGQDLKPVDGLTPDQRFFVGMAQWACGEERPEMKRMHAITDPHSPDQFRINGVVSNLSQFGEAFGCKVGQPMRPAHACRVW
jgi:putative endopeptidase